LIEAFEEETEIVSEDFRFQKQYFRKRSWQQGVRHGSANLNRLSKYCQ
jgi:hypothetical protein